MDNQMVERFKEMATEIELVSNQYKEEASKDASKEKFETFKSVHVPKLQTISQAMFNKASFHEFRYKSYCPAEVATVVPFRCKIADERNNGEVGVN